MKKLLGVMVAFTFVLSVLVLYGGNNNLCTQQVYAQDQEEVDCFCIYDADDESKLIFMKGESVSIDDEYISADNKLYVIESVDEETRTGKARYRENVKLPVYKINKKSNIQEVSAVSEKKIGMYHTHNDECYDAADGTDSVYGRGGIHDVGAVLKENFETLGITVYYSEDLHLPHNSGAYTRSQATASMLMQNGVDAIFDIHRDATPRSEYITSVNGVEMSKVRMVVGSANQNSEVNKEFALCIKAYADEVYPGLIKDIYIGKGNYNQQLSSRAMLFEMGTNLIEKELVMKSCVPLAKTLDVVLYGTNYASAESTGEIDAETSEGDYLQTGLTGAEESGENTPAQNNTLWVVLGILGTTIAFVALVYAFDRNFRNKTNTFFSELTAGIMGKRKTNGK